MAGYSEYETLKIEQKYCEDKAQHYSDVRDFTLATFYTNAAKGFAEKAENLTVEKATKGLCK